MFKVYRFSGVEKGANILFLGAVHGNEIAGTIAQKEIIIKTRKTHNYNTLIIRHL